MTRNAVLCAVLALVGCASERSAPAPVYNAMLETHDRSAGAHMVSRDESLEKIAGNYKVTIDDILAANNLADASQIAPGQRLYMPDRATLSGMSDVSLATPQNPHQQTFVARASGEMPLDGSQPQQDDQNNGVGFQPLDAASPLRSVVTAEPLTPMASDTAAPVATAAVTPEMPVAAVSTAPAPMEPVKVASRLSPDQWADPVVNGFRWPVKGPTLSDFGAKAGGLKNDGINIGANMGAPVEAAADGEVLYTGNAVEGFGNLVLVKHKGNFVTAYGHLSRVDVVKGQGVAAGEIIGGVGQSGSVSAPQLHFQVRQGSKILNPTQYLSRGTTQTAGL